MAPSVLAAYDIEIDPEEGSIGTEVTVTGEGFGWSETTDRYSTVYFSEDEANTGDHIDDEVENYERVVALEEILEANDGSFEATFDVPDELTDGEDDVEVTSGTYYVYVVVTTEVETILSTYIRSVAEFEVIGGGLVEINLKQDTTDIADGGAHDFGNGTVNTNTDVTFTIENTGTAALTLTTPLAIGGANADQFSIQAQPAATVAASGNTAFTVRFTPTSTGAKTATISIANNDGDENPYDLTITGTGTAVVATAGGGGSYYYPEVEILGSSQHLVADDSGRVLKTVETTSSDGSLTITINKGTVAKQENGRALRGLDVTESENLPPLPEGSHVIGLAYDFGPDGATFAPPLTLTFTYDPETLPEGVSEADLVLAFYDEDTGEWVELECTVDTENNTITACVSHFTDFAIIGEAMPEEPPAEDIPSTPPEDVTEPEESQTITEPEPAPEPESAIMPPAEEDSAPPVTAPEPSVSETPLPIAEPETNWLLIGIIAAVAVVLVVFLAYRFATRKD